MATEFVTLREFDNFVKTNEKQQESIWHSIEQSVAANAKTSETVAVLASQIKEDREERRTKDQRVWALTLTFIGVMFTASIPFIVKTAEFVFGFVGKF